MAINFPSSPTVNQQYTYNGLTWYWTGQVWKSVGTVQGVQGLQGVQGFGYAQLQGVQGISGLTGNYQSIQGAGSSVTPRAALNFTNATVIDDSANNRTNVTIGVINYIVDYLDGGSASSNSDIIYDAGINGSTTTNWNYTIDAGASIVSF
jgi:hypothetical protein